MIRAQCIVNRGNKVLMVKHTFEGREWWCLPGGGVEPGETPAKAALRELKEECCVDGTILCQVSQAGFDFDLQSVTFLVDIGDQEPKVGKDPEFSTREQILTDMRWLRLDQICERDRAYLFAAGLMSVPDFEDEVSGWGDEISYPTE